MNQAKRLIAAVLVVASLPMVAAAAEPFHPSKPSVIVIEGVPGAFEVAPLADKPSDKVAATAWLGVQLAPVPAALASHLKLDDVGVMVRNIFKDSPADKAGLERYDVIVSVDGKPVNEGVAAFSQFVRDRKPGDSLELGIYRGGAKSSLGVKLGSTPEALDEMAMKYEDDPDVAQRRLFGLRGKILRPGPEGWVLDDLGDLPAMPELKEWLKGHSEQGEPGTPGEMESMRVDRDGNALQVRRNKDGSIEVRRYKSGTPAEKAEVKKYDNIDELRKSDADAARMLESMGKPEEGPRHGLSDYERQLKDYKDALRHYMDRYEKQWERRVPTPKSPRWQEWNQRVLPPVAPTPPVPPQAMPMRPGGGGGMGGGMAAPAPAPETQTSFIVQPDGSITAEVNDGATRLTMTFPNEDAFKLQAPKLYERFRATLERTK